MATRRANEAAERSPRVNDQVHVLTLLHFFLTWNFAAGLSRGGSTALLERAIQGDPHPEGRVFAPSTASRLTSQSAAKNQRRGFGAMTGRARRRSVPNVGQPLAPINGEVRKNGKTSRTAFVDDPGAVERACRRREQLIRHLSFSVEGISGKPVQHLTFYRRP